jgi:methionine synthase II (cobalamin-independent)
MAIQTKCIATAIGSFPHTDREAALDIVFKALTHAPLWPQLPKLGLNEQMEIQYSEGMPRAVIDREKGRMYFDTTGDYSEDFALFYETYMTAMDPDEGTGDCSAMAISPEFSQGLEAFEERLKASGKKFPFVKVQTTGPCSFALTITDENKRAVWYNEEFRDVVVKALAMKCRWQIRKFAPYAEKVICFIDEPILSAFGSSTYIAVKRDEVVAAIAETADAVHAEEAIAGVHCCGNTDWSILIDAGVDLINLDAYAYGETIALYPEAVKAFLSKGGLIAWGVVPTSAAIRDVTVEDLAAKFAGLVDNLATKAGVDKGLVIDQSLVTPSCGTGSLPREDAEMVFEKLEAVSRLVRSGL